MLLRDRQKRFVDAAQARLAERGNTLGLAPTGAGKTVMLSAIVAGMGGRTLVLQHRDELVDQNAKTFKRVAPGWALGTFDAKKKWFGDCTFAMVQTLVRNLDEIPKLDLVVTDEAHHAAADSYLQIYAAARAKNPGVKMLGVTATPERGDERGLRGVYDNVCDQITLAELVAAGYLVRPRTFVIDLGEREALSEVRKTASGEYDMSQVAKIMDKEAVTNRVIEEWQRVAGDRQTVVFASTVEHAKHVTEAFRTFGVSAEWIDGEMASGDRRRVLEDFDARRFQVIVNCMVLTEGWDCQPVSCVVLLRPSSYKSTMIQMIGRGLRKLDPERYPGVAKTDCTVLDFGCSLLTHGGLEQHINLDAQETVTCPECESVLPGGVDHCAICGYVWPKEPTEATEPVDDLAAADKARELLDSFVMTEIDLFDASPFKWEALFDGLVTVADGIEAWAMCVNYRGQWCAVGGGREVGMRLLAVEPERMIALATADDFLREHGDSEAAAKSKRWMTMPPSDKQLQILGIDPLGSMGLTRYRASCMLTWKFNEAGVRLKLMGVGQQRAVAA